MALGGRRPNILLITTDQQHHRMMSCAGETANIAGRPEARDALLEHRAILTRWVAANADTKGVRYVGMLPR